MDLTVTIAAVSELSVITLEALVVLLIGSYSVVTTDVIALSVGIDLLTTVTVVSEMDEILLRDFLYLSISIAAVSFTSMILLVTDPLGAIDDTGYSSITTKRGYKSLIL